MSQENATSTPDLDAHQKDTIRHALVESARKLLGVKYEFGSEWSDITKLPEALDCSELTEGTYHQNGLKMPDGSQSQFLFTIPTGTPLPGDLGFFGRGGNPAQVYHVGMIFETHLNQFGNPFGQVIEARGFQPGASFETGKVILRP